MSPITRRPQPEDHVIRWRELGDRIAERILAQWQLRFWALRDNDPDLPPVVLERLALAASAILVGEEWINAPLVLPRPSVANWYGDNPDDMPVRDAVALTITVARYEDYCGGGPTDQAYSIADRLLADYTIERKR